jgi:hypothetical protein
LLLLLLLLLLLEEEEEEEEEVVDAVATAMYIVESGQKIRAGEAVRVAIDSRSRRPK